MGRIYYLMGKSASGKDTIYKMLLERNPGLRRIVLYTTRPMREGEQDGVEYHFTTGERLGELERAGKVIECRTYETVYGPWSYATVDDGQIVPEEADYLAIGTLESYGKLREYYGAGRVTPLYITVDDGERLERALARERRQKEPRYAELCRRYLADEADFAPENLKRLGITRSYPNDGLEQCVEELEQTIFYTEP
ncbi:MAG TPA: guanylate kinase [Candidatus Ventrimonas merdavium]|mgnify:CR=1 FL=1|nr:guanylate kinase [Candidatus Ventrimonas merdavium]